VTHAADPGVGNERTALAWQRTALSVLAGAAIVGRLAFSELGVAALVGPAIAVPLSAWILIEGSARYQRRASSVGARRSGGRGPAFLGCATLVLLLTELAAVLGG
jgi:uncharacterized membrane protein YidH (DUF202 family)